MFSEKLKALRKEYGITQAQLAERLNISQQAVGLWERNKNAPNKPLLTEIAKMFHVSLDYLLDNPEPIYQNKQQLYGNKTPLFHGELPPAQHVETVKIPVLGWCHCGDADDAEQNTIGYEDLDKTRFSHGRKYFALETVGDSMQPYILDGDIVIVQRQEYLNNGDVGVFVLDGQTAIKKYTETPSGVVLKAYNTKYDDIKLSETQIERMRIDGKIIEIRRRNLP